VRSAGRILAVCGGALAALLATLLLGFAIGGGTFAQYVGDMVGDAATSATGRSAFALVGMALLAVDIWLVLRGLGFGAAKRIEFESSAGRMVVDLSALEEALRRRALEHEDVADAKASIRIPGGGLAKPIVCDVDVGIRERADVPGRGAEIADRLRRGFLRIIPIETDPVINLAIHIRPPPPCEESAKATVAMPAVGAEGDDAPADGETPEPPLPDVPDFTGERRYGKAGEEDADGEPG
jgi:hypothetical protein